VRRLASHPPHRGLVALSWVPTNSGLVQDAAAVGEVCTELRVPYLIDGCQAVGQLAVDVGELRCDFLAGTGRKIPAPARAASASSMCPTGCSSAGAFPLFLDMRGADWTDPDAFRLADDATPVRELGVFAYGPGGRAWERPARYSLAVGSAGPGGGPRRARPPRCAPGSPRFPECACSIGGGSSVPS